jgi:hypothetical protein
MRLPTAMISLLTRLEVLMQFTLECLWRKINHWYLILRHYLQESPKINLKQFSGFPLRDGLF